MDRELNVGERSLIASFLYATMKHPYVSFQRHKNKSDMSGVCWTVVEQRLHENAHDIRLQPGLLHACKDEVKQLCPTEHELIKSVQPDQGEAEGSVVGCLRDKITSRHNSVRGQISTQCANEVRWSLLHY